MALAIRSIKYRCVRNSGAFPSTTKQASLSAPHPEPYSLPCGEVPAKWQLSRQEPAFFCGRAQSAGVKRWCQAAATAFRNQKSQVPKSFKRTKPSSSLPSTVFSLSSQAHLLLSLTLYFYTVTQLQQEEEEKSCGKEHSTANPCDAQRLLQSMQRPIPVKVYGTEIQVMACQLHCSSFLCAYHRFTSW